jgi:pantoate--beta-alanine ligase
MQIVNTKKSIFELVSKLKGKNKTVGFVPTMGAIHDGHLSLIEKAYKKCDVVVCSIFLNPTQFNNAQDYKNYPVSFEKDIKLLENSDCTILFAPSTDEMYPKNEKSYSFNLNKLDQYYEGQKRPGHFDGVCTIVSKLFDCIPADYAFFGQKDFQQLAIIKHLSKQLEIKPKIIGCPTMREDDGLAMSSRNKLLNSEQRQKASSLYQIMLKARGMYQNKPIEEIIISIEQFIAKEPTMELDYVAIADAETLTPIRKKTSNKQAVLLIAVYFDNVRLIDNLILNE